jgi:alkylated DNA nucleotide flippase Atl1
MRLVLAYDSQGRYGVAITTLTDVERSDVPWHRVVAESGALNRTQHGRGAEQRATLEAEGIAISPRGVVVDLPTVLWLPE